MKTKNTVDLTTGNVTKRLLAFALPIALSNLLQHTYDIADKVVVGQFAENGMQALAGIGATSYITALVLNMCNGVGLGANVRCSNMRGSGEDSALRKSMHTSVMLSVIMGVLFGLIGLGLTQPLLQLLNTPSDIFSLAKLYLLLYFAGLVFSVVYSFGANILLSSGESKRATLIMIVSGLVNVALNLVFVILFDMSVAGVALATVISKMVAAGWVLWILFDPKGAYALTRKELGIDTQSLRAILRVGIPSGINGMLFSLSNLIAQSAVNSFKETALLAGKSAATDVSNLFYQVIYGFYSACVSFSGQCFGAKNYKRIDALAGRAILSCCAAIAVLATLCTLFPNVAIGIFNSDPGVIKAGTGILLICSWGYVIFSVSEIFMACSRGMGKATGTMVLNIMAICVTRLIWIYFFFPMHRSLEWLFVCYPLSWLVGAIMQSSYYFYCRRQLNKMA